MLLFPLLLFCFVFVSAVPHDMFHVNKVFWTLIAVHEQTIHTDFRGRLFSHLSFKHM